MEGPSHRIRTSTRHDWWWIFDPRHSWRARAALIVGGAAVAFALFFSWLAGTILHRTLETQTGTTFESLAFQVGDKIDRILYERYRTLQLGATLAPLRSLDAAANERRRVLETLQESSPEFAWIGFADASGKIIAATNGLFENADANSRPWFLAAREAPFAGNPHEQPELAREVPATSESESTPRFLDLAVPVTGANGQFAGVLAAHLRWDWTRDVQRSVVPETSARQQIGVTVYTATGEVLLDSGASGWTLPPDHPPITDNRRARGFLLEHTTLGSSYLSGYARSRGFREYRGLGWLTVVRQPLARAFLPVEELRRSILRWGLFLAVSGTIAAWVTAGRAERRLRSVAASADRIREGDVLAAMPRPRDESEMARMCGAVADLVEDLRGKNETLLAENAQLAARLREHNPDPH